LIMPVALILGATSDIAIAIAKKFASAQYDIQLAARKTDQLRALQSDLVVRYGVTCTLHDFDALAFSSHARFFDSLDPKPDVSICVFGLMEAEEKAFDDFELAHRMIDTNFTGPVSVLNVIAKYYASQKKGVIVGISSVAGERGRQSKLVYGSSKAAFSAYLAGLRNQLFKDQVHVLSVKPGFVRTKMTEEMKLPPALTADPAEVAEAVYRGVVNKKNTVYVRWMWRWIMLIIKCIPEFQFKKMNL
jgi:decaprenylphospho-beta-D-erythro-pentofuranosid-2-ulose 2-reductase